MFGYPDDGEKWRSSADIIEGSLKLLFDPESQSYRKGLLLLPNGDLQFDNTIDISSMYGILMFTKTRTDNTALQQTLAAIESNLINTGIGGVIRYQNDNYMKKDGLPPNPWFVCTYWLAQYYVQSKQTQKARAIVDWSLTHTLNSGIMSEQIHPVTGSPLGVAPLVWSHAELINTVLDISGNN
jgi:GH15 family glucan-1,4-alpha-glucosidase